MRAFLVVAVLALSLAGAVWCSPDGYVAGAGGTQPVNLNAASQSGAYGNPALLGLGRAPRGGLAFLPMSVGLWSDDLALPSILLNKYLLEGDWPRLLTSVLYESFDLYDVKDDPYEVSRKLTDGMRDGIGIYFGYQVSPFVFSAKGFSVGMRTYVDLEARLPGGILLPFFSATEGAQGGRMFGFSDLSVDLTAATELSVKIGRPIPALPAFFDYAGLDKGAYGVGIKHILGHSYLSLNLDEGSGIYYDSAANVYRIVTKIDAVSAGTGLKHNYEFDSRYWDSAFVSRPVVGEGWGFDIGAVFHNDNHFVSVDIQDIGMIVWDGRKTQRNKGVYQDSIILDSLRDMSGSYRKNVLNSDFLDNFLDKMVDATGDSSGRNHVSYLPMSLNLGYTYYLGFSDMALKYLVRYVTANAGLKQQIITGPGKNAAAPALSLGASAGLINGVFPLRYGVTVGGPGKSSSAVSAGVNMRAVSFDVCYKAVGHPFLIAEKGFEGAAAFTVNWGWDKKKKKEAGEVTSPQ